MLPLATHCHTPLHLHSFHFMVLIVVAKQHPFYYIHILPWSDLPFTVMSDVTLQHDLPLTGALYPGSPPENREKSLHGHKAKWPLLTHIYLWYSMMSLWCNGQHIYLQYCDVIMM